MVEIQTRDVSKQGKEIDPIRSNETGDSNRSLYLIGGSREAFRTVRRSLLERYVHILYALKMSGPVRKTRIMYKANLTWDELKEDLQHLKNAGLIRELAWKEGIFYGITDLGIQTLFHYSELSKSLRVRSLTEW
ncbi:MAG: hypothetical protein HY619_03450 [Thaumarchaeota archaeon]|nr:hypothetical protein [Nitrososphaerota archaeon]